MIKDYLENDSGLLSKNKILSPERDENFEEPGNLTGRQLLGKTLIGLIVGGIISAILFILLSFIGKIFTDAMQQTNEIIRTNPILPILLLFIGFLGSFIGNIIIAVSYNLFFSKKYYDISKMFGLLLLTNGILFFILAPVYLVFSKQTETLFIILGFHVFFSILISANQMEFLSKPNYSSSAMMGNLFGFCIAMLIYSLIRKQSDMGSIQNKIYLLMLVPSILGYAAIPFGHGIREKIYYKVYESGNNPMYIATNVKLSDSFNQDKKEDNEQTNIDLN